MTSLGTTVRKALAALFFAAPLLFLMMPSAIAADCINCSEWASRHISNGLPTTFTRAGSWLVHAVDGIVYVRAADGRQLSYYPTPGIARGPVAVDLGTPDEPHWYVFAAAVDGYLYKLDLATPLPSTLPLAATGAKPQLRDLRRGFCATDSLIAEPIVQRVADSNAGSTLSKDIVMVATARGCSDTTQNQVIALDAADITAPPLWVFNVGEYEIAKIHSCLLDLARNRLVCGAEHPGAAFQPALFSIDTNDGSLAWAASYDVGVHARVALGAEGEPGAGHVYAGDQGGHVRSFDASDGSPRSDLAIVFGQQPMIDYDLAAAGGYVFAVGSSGKVTGLYDDGTDLIDEWDTALASGQHFVTAPAPIDAIKKVYVGTEDGKFHQLNMYSGADEASAVIGGAGSIAVLPEDRHMTVSTYSGADGGYRMVSSYDDPDNGTVSQQYLVPCRYATPCVPDVLIFRSGFE